MIPEIDMWCAANLLLKRHGRDAAIVAVQRADECLAGGDVPANLLIVEAFSSCSGRV